MKKYEGLFILNTAGKEEGVKEITDKIAAEIVAAGGTVETIQKMDKKSFSRVANKKASSGFYVNYIFSGPTTIIAALRTRFAMSEDVFRAILTVAPKPKEVAAAAPQVV